MVIKPNCSSAKSLRACRKIKSTGSSANSQEISLKAGDDLFATKAIPRTRCSSCSKGKCRRAANWAARSVVFTLPPADVTGILPFSRMKQFTVGGKALTDGRFLRFPRPSFPDLVQKMPELTQRLVGLMSDESAKSPAWNSSATAWRRSENSRRASLTNSIILPPRQSAPLANCAAR